MDESPKNVSIEQQSLQTLTPLLEAIGRSVKDDTKFRVLKEDDVADNMTFKPTDEQRKLLKQLCETGITIDEIQSVYTDVCKNIGTQVLDIGRKNQQINDDDDDIDYIASNGNDNGNGKKRTSAVAFGGPISDFRGKTPKIGGRKIRSRKLRTRQQRTLKKQSKR